MKTVSLAEALRSGKAFVLRIPGTPVEVKYMKGEVLKETVVWSNDAILHAECQIIEEPREIWVWERPGGDLMAYSSKHRDDIKFTYKGEQGRPVKFREVCDE